MLGHPFLCGGGIGGSLVGIVVIVPRLSWVLQHRGGAGFSSALKCKTAPGLWRIVSK